MRGAAFKSSTFRQLLGGISIRLLLLKLICGFPAKSVLGVRFTEDWDVVSGRIADAVNAIEASSAPAQSLPGMTASLFAVSLHALSLLERDSSPAEVWVSKNDVKSE